MARRDPLTESFLSGPAGWLQYGNMHTLNDVQGGGFFTPEYIAPGADGADPAGNGVVTSRSPWWVDYNHAPPTSDGRGAGPPQTTGSKTMCRNPCLPRPPGPPSCIRHRASQPINAPYDAPHIGEYERWQATAAATCTWCSST
jgi:hypothetical protein